MLNLSWVDWDRGFSIFTSSFWLWGIFKIPSWHTGELLADMGTFWGDKIHIHKRHIFPVFFSVACVRCISVEPMTVPRSSFCKQAAWSQHRASRPVKISCTSLAWVELNMHCSHSDSQLWASTKSKQTYDSCGHCCAPPMNPYLSVCLSVKPLISESDPKELSSSMWLLLIVRILLVSIDWRPFSILAILAGELTGWREKLTSASWLTDNPNAKVLLCLCCMKFRRRHDFSTSRSKYSLGIYNTTTVRLRYALAR